MTSHFAGAYKIKSGTFDRTSVRVRRKSSEWKNNRVDGVNKLRHLDKLSPLQELDGNTPNKVEYDGKTPHKSNKGKIADSKTGKTATTDRREQLAKWLQQKEMKKKLEANDKRKQPFKVVRNTHKDSDLYRSEAEKSVKPKEAHVESKDPSRLSTMKKTKAAVCTRTGAESKVEPKNPSRITETHKTKGAGYTTTRPKSKNDGKQKEKTVSRSVKGAENKKPSPCRVTRQSARQASLAASNKFQPDKKTKAAAVKIDKKVPGKPHTRSTKKEKIEHKTNIEIDSVKVNIDRGNSFAPADFTFEAPSNITSFIFKPLSPASAENFLFPSIDVQPSMLETPVPDSERNFRFSTPKTSGKEKRVEHSPPAKMSDNVIGEIQGNDMVASCSHQFEEAKNVVPEQDNTLNDQQSESDPGTSGSNVSTKDKIQNTPRRSTRVRKSQIFAANDKDTDSGVSLGDEDSKVTKMECDTTVNDGMMSSVVHSPMTRSARKSLLQKKELSSADGSKIEPESTTSDTEVQDSETLLTGTTDNISIDSNRMLETCSENVVSSAICESAEIDCSVESKSTTVIEANNSFEEVKVNTENMINSLSEISVNDFVKTTHLINAATGITGTLVSEKVTPIRSRKTRKTLSAVDEFVKPSPEMAPSSQRRSAKKRRRTEASSTPSLIRSPEEWVKILENSPMIEMERRTPKTNTPPGRSLPLLDLDDIDDIDLNNPDDCKTQSHTIENKENICPTVSSTSDVEKPKETSETFSEPFNFNEVNVEHNVEYFRKIMLSETARLNKLGEQWNDVMASLPDMSEEHKGQIRTTIGQSQLLMNQRFKQFSGLIDNCEFRTGEKETTCTDLDGFWDMIYFQVEDVDKKFFELDQLKAKNWIEEKPKPVKKTVPKKKLPTKSKPAGKSKFSEFRAQMKKQKEETVVFDAGFFKVSSPAKTPAFHCEGGTPKKKLEESKMSSHSEIDTENVTMLKTSEEISPHSNVDTENATTLKNSQENSDNKNQESPSVKPNQIIGDKPSGTSIPSRRSYIPAIPSPLLKDSTPKVEPRRRSFRNTPLPKRQILASIDDSLSEMNDMIKDLSDKPLPKTPTISSAPRRLSLRRSIQKRKSVSFMETKENAEPESDVLAKYLQPTPVMNPPMTRSRRSSITFEEPEEDKDKENDDVFLKYIQPSFPNTEYESTKSKKSSCLKILPSSERRKSRRSVHFESPTVDYSNRTRHASTPYNRSSLVPHRRVGKDDSLFESPQKCTPSRKSNADLMSFSPW